MSKINKNLTLFIIFSILLVSVGFYAYAETSDRDDIDEEAQSEIDDLQGSINEKRKRIEELDKEISAYTSAAAEKSEEADTLEGRISRLQSEVNAIQSQIAKTETEIAKSQEEIDLSVSKISEAEDQISLYRGNVKELIRSLDKSSDKSLINTLLSYTSLGEFFRDQNSTVNIQNKIKGKIDAVNDLKKEIEKQKIEQEAKKAELVDLKAQSVVQKNAVDAVKKEQEDILEKTEGQESLYRKMASTADEEKRKLYAELADTQNAIAVLRVQATGSVSVSKGIFINPVKGNYVLTQGFGCVNSNWYPEGGCGIGKSFHNGLDLAASMGTPLVAVTDGKIAATGFNSGWGNWIYFATNNGVIALYAHLSGFAASVGQTVKQGEVIGYMGSTGFSTGSHLHFSVYPSGASVVESSGGNGPAYLTNTAYNPAAFIAF